MTPQWLGLILCDFRGVRPAGCPSGVRPVPGPAVLSGILASLAGLAGLAGLAWPGLAGLRDALASRSFPLLPVRVSAANLR